MNQAPLHFRSRSGRLALTASILGSGMAFVDATAVNVALPALGDDLRAGFADLQWVINAYLVTLGALVLLGGALSDVYGRRRLFLTGAVWFALASVGCGLAPDVNTLIAARALQGMGAALLVPSSLAMIQSGFRPDDRGRAIGAWSGFSGLSTLIGPLLGGWLVDSVSWRAVFLINPVLALATIMIALVAFPRDAPRPARYKVDALGGVTASGSLGGIVFFLIQGPQWGWQHPAVVAGGVVGALAGVAFLDIERSLTRPMLPLTLFRRRSFLAANLVTLTLYLVLSGTFFLLMLQLQRVLGYSAFGAGAAVAPITLLLLVLSPMSGRWTDRRGPRPPIALGLCLAAGGLVLLAGIGASARYASDILPGVILVGLGLGATVAPLTAAALSSLDESQAGLASGVNNAVARIAQLLGIPLLPLLAGLGGLERAAGSALATGFGRAMGAGATILLIGAILAWSTLPRPHRSPTRGAEDGGASIPSEPH